MGQSVPSTFVLGTAEFALIADAGAAWRPDAALVEGTTGDVADDARCPLWNSDFFNSQLFCCYFFGIQGKGNYQRPTVYNLVGVGNINFDCLRSVAPLSIRDLGGVG
jgi:hypothetical protein